MSAAAIAMLVLAQAGQPWEPASAALVLDPTVVEVGEPVRCRLEVRHPEGARPRLAGQGLALDPSWVILDERGRLTEPDPSRPGISITRLEWSLASLEPGPRELPELAVELDVAGEVLRVAAPATRLEVTSLIAEGETGPRGLLGFREPTEPEGGTALLGAEVAGGLILAGAALLLLRRWRRRRAARAPAEELGPDPLEELRLLASELPRDPEDVRELHFALTRLVRTAGDRRRASDRSGLTDEEWLAGIADDGLSPRVQEGIRALFDACEAVKYGSEDPSPFAVRENLERARELCASLSEAEVAA